MPIIILTARGQSVDRDAALEAGANDYLTKPVTMNELLDHVTGLLARTAAASAPPGETVALLGLRGGMGVTTLATNLALIFAGQSPDKVCLVDLNPSSGHVALQLGMRPEPNWSAFGDVAPDRERIREYLLVHPARLHVLAAPYVPVIGQGLGPDTVTALLAALRQNFSTVVVDTPAVLTEGAAAALDAADVIGVVVTADPMAIQTAIGTLQTLQPLASKVQLILNQIVPGPPPPVDVLQRVLKRAFAGVVLYDPAQAQALVSGKPLALTSAASPLAQEVRVLAGRLRIRQAQPAGVL
jgi:pilus assembly protein CpaE